MSKGKILKIRVGHEANCSSEMVVMYMLALGGVTYLPMSLITTAVQAAKLRTDTPRGWKRLLYWFVPQIVGLGLTAYFVRLAFNSSYSVIGPVVMALTMGMSLFVSITASYILVPRLKHRSLIYLIAPLVMVLSCIALYWLSVVYGEVVRKVLSPLL